MDSNYYKTQYQNYSNQVTEYKKWINELTKIKNSLTSDFGDNQRITNSSLSDLESDLDKAVKYNEKFTSNTELCEEHKENLTFADSNLQDAIFYLEEEISSLNQKEANAESNRDSSLSQYNTKKEEERQALLDANKVL